MPPNRETAVTAVLIVTQWLGWTSSYYLLTVLAVPIVEDTTWPLTFVVAGLSLGLVVAGLISPFVGRAIELRGGRPVLALGSLTSAIGLIGIGLARSPLAYVAAWAILGLGMGASLYDAAFAAVVRLFGLRGRAVISNLMLICAFIGAFSWPASAFLAGNLGWRGACFCYAGMHLVLALPLHLFLLPKQSALQASAPVTPSAASPDPDAMAARGGATSPTMAWLLGANVTLQTGIGSLLAVHLLALLQGVGMAYVAAVGFGSVLWLSQAGARLIEAVAGRRFHPASQGVIASFLVFAGLALLAAAQPWAVAAGLVLYGFGNGIRAILKGTLPLVLFGADGYATLIGRLGLPTLIAQAAGPALGAVALARWGAMPSLLFLVALALLNLGLSYVLRIAVPRAAP
jgi:Major Facilitator Superfamily